MKLVLLTAFSLCLALPAQAADLTLYAAGSLKGAMTEIITAYTKATGQPVRSEFGPSGLLRERIEAGEPVDLFASADIGHPRTLVRNGKVPYLIRFTGNRLCAMAKPELGLTTGNVLDKALDPAVRLGTSTPKADPSGDYTWQAFAKAESLRPGAEATLQAKARQLVGGPNSEKIPSGKSAVPYMFETGKADMFLAYCTTGKAAAAEGVPLTVVDLPPTLGVGADYGMAVLKPDASALALFILSEIGQGILSKWGFASMVP